MTKKEEYEQYIRNLETGIQNLNATINDLIRDRDIANDQREQAIESKARLSKEQNEEINRCYATIDAYRMVLKDQIDLYADR